MTRLWVRQPRKSGSIPGRDKRFISSPRVQTPSEGPNQPPVQWVLGVWRVLSPSVKLRAHLHLVLTSAMCTATPPCLWRPSCHMQGQLTFTTLYCQNKVKISSWHQHEPFNTSQHISDSNQRITYSLQVPVACSCIFFIFWGLQWVGYVYVCRCNTRLENFGRESSHLENDFMAGAGFPTVGPCFLWCWTLKQIMQPKS